MKTLQKMPRAPSDGPWRLHAWLAIGSLALATIAYCAPNALTRSDALTLVHTPVQRMQSITLASGDHSLTLVCQEGRVTRIENAQASAGRSSITQYRPSDAAQAMLQRSAQLTALRALGPQDLPHVQSFGLGNANAPHLTVHSADGDQSFVVGRSVYGSGDVYLLRPPQDVFVVSPMVLRDFDHDGVALKDTHVLEQEGSPATHMTLVLPHGTCTFERSEDAGTPGWRPMNNTPGATSPHSATVAQFYEQLRTMTFVEALGTEAAAQKSRPADLTIELGTGGREGPAAKLQLYDAHTAPKLVGTYPLGVVSMGVAAVEALLGAAAELCGGPARPQ